MRDNILIIGARGQIGTVLTEYCRNIYGEESIIAADIQPSSYGEGRYAQLDATNASALFEVVQKYKITQIYHLAAILSAKGESDPLTAWDLNMKTLFNVLQAARELKLKKIFFPSSIAVFGDSAPKYQTVQKVFLDPSTAYGISKVAGENWINYYHSQYGLDIRSLRYPGIISHQSMPGGGTTDYAVEIFHKAVKSENYECFLKENTRLPMMYIDDAIRATHELMEMPANKITSGQSYNIAGMSFTPAEITACIQKHIPNFKVNYQRSSRQLIADSWPKTIEDTEARNDWGWKPEFNLENMTAVMIEKLKAKYQREKVTTNK